TQFRGENSKAGYWEAKAAALSRMENVMNETPDNGLAKSMDLFWNSLQDLSTNPTHSVARSVVVHRGIALADTFNYLSNSLTKIQGDLQSEINHTVDVANSLMNQINEINKQVKQIEPHGYLANDLYDERDRLIDELSGIVDIKVSYTSSGDGALKTADGLATIELVQGDNKITLVDGEELDYHELKVNYDDTTEINVIGKKDEVPIDTSSFTGSLNALVHAYDEVYPEMISDLDAMANAFQKEFNKIHGQGYDLNRDQGKYFFEGSLTAGNFKVNDEIIKNPDLIAVSSSEGSDDGDNALDLADVFDEQIVIGNDGEKTSVKEFYESIIGDMGVSAQEANRMTENTYILRSQVDNQRQSVSSVSLDEEMTNMIKFQHAYNAAARSMTAMDELLDKIINGMGIVGR